METEMIQKTYHVSTCLLGIMLPQKTNKTPVPAILSHQHMDYDVTVIIRWSDSFGSIYKIQKETKSKYMKHQKQPLRDFLQSRFYDTLTPK